MAGECDHQRSREASEACRTPGGRATEAMWRAQLRSTEQ